MPVSTRGGVLGTPVVVLSDPAALPPLPPLNPRASNLTQNSLTLGWDPPAGGSVSSYRVYQVVAGVDTLIGSPAATSFDVGSLSAGTLYTFKIVSVAGSLASDPLVYSVTTQAVADTTPPTDPVIGTVTATSSTVTVPWAASTDTSGIAAYEVFLVVDSVDVSQGTTTGLTFTVTGLQAATSYTIKVQAIDGVGLRSNKVSTTKTTASDTTAPTVPTPVTVSAVGPAAATLSWPASTDTQSGVAGYEITRNLVVVATIAAPTTTYTLTGLNSSTQYTFNVRAFDNAGNRSIGAPASFTTTAPPDTDPPTIPTGTLRTTAVAQTTVDVAVDAASDTGSGVAGYEWFLGFFVVGTTSDPSFQHTGLSPNTTYGLNVRAFDNAGNRSSFAGAITVTTAAAGGTAWPPQDFTDGWGVTLNNLPFSGNATAALRWQDRADGLLAAMDNPAEWNVSRIQVDLGTLDPNGNGTYNFKAGDVQAKVDWCVDNGIRPILMATFPPVNQTVILNITGCSVTNVGGKARISGANLDGNYNFLSLSAHGTGIPDPNYVTATGSAGGVPYADLNVAPTSTGSGRTIRFGGQGGAASADDHLWVANGTGLHGSIDDGTTNHLMSLAKAVAALAAHFAYANPIIEYWNEANGDHGRRPAANPVDRYLTELRYIYRAVKEYDPTIPVLFTGVNNNDKRSESQRSLDGPIFLRLAWARMAADTAWNDGNGGGWVNATTNLLTTSNTPTGFAGVGRYTMASLLASGSVSPRYWLDYVGFHSYALGRTGSTLNADNYRYWSDPDADFDGGYNPANQTTGHFSTAARFVRMLNDIHAASIATGGDPNLDRIRFIATETMPPSHPLAKTGVGGRSNEGFPNDSGSGANAAAASSEEWGCAVYEIKAYKRGAKSWPTGANIPAYLGPGNVEDRWACINLQWLTETPQTYQGAGTFFFQGFWTSTTIGSVPAGTLKTAVGSDAAARQHLKDGVTHNGDSHWFSNSNFPAAVVDGITAFDHVVP